MMARNFMGKLERFLTTNMVILQKKSRNENVARI